MSSSNQTPIYKPFTLPPHFSPPAHLASGLLFAEPLTPKHLAEDLAAVNSSLSLIRRTRGGSWPSGPLTEEANERDLTWHEREFHDRSSFAYAVFETVDGAEGGSEGRRGGEGEGAERAKYVGCFYLLPAGAKKKMSKSELEAWDVDASWWVTTDAYERGVYARLYAALRTWLMEEFPFEMRRVFWSNEEIPGEV